MRIGIWHGGFLRSGEADVSIRELSRVFCRAGHEVTLFSHEATPERLDHVAVIRRDGKEALRRLVKFRGRCTSVRPDFADIVPLHVQETHLGLPVSEFASMDEESLDRYVDHGANLVTDAVVRDDLEVLIANDLGPAAAIVARGARERAVPYLVRGHGVEVSRTISNSSAARRLAREGLAGARAVVCSSQGTASRLLGAVGDEVDGLAERVVILPHGVDLDTFRLRLGETAPQAAGRLLDALRGNVRGRPARASSTVDRIIEALRGDPQALRKTLEALTHHYDCNGPDEALPEALGRMTHWPAETEALVYVGRVAEDKGVLELVASLPALLRERPTLALVLIGNGSAREQVEAMVQAMAHQDAPLFDNLLNASGISLPPQVRQAFVPHGPSAAQRFMSTGNLEHRQLRHLLSAAPIVVCPSRAPEGFPMAAVEAMACGSVPVCSDQGGHRDLLDAAAAGLPENVSPLCRLNPEYISASLVSQIPPLLSQLESGRRVYASNMRQAVSDQYHWDKLGERLLQVVQACAPSAGLLPFQGDPRCGARPGRQPGLS